MPLPSRADALALLEEHLTSDYLRRHSLATEAVLRALATRLGADIELWGLTGLLHDLDLEIGGEADPTQHARITTRILAERYDFPKEGLDAILAHNGDVLDIPCRSLLDSALTAGESITGLVFATALVLPSKDLAEVKPKSVRKRIKEPRFAAKVSRERIGHWAALRLDEAEFVEIAVTAMQAAGL